MVNMKEMKKKLTDATAMNKISIFKDGKDKLLIDFTGDGKADAALIDTTGNGEPDVLALDMTGDNKFNLFLDDTDDNECPDVIYIDEKGDGNVQLLSIGEAAENIYQMKLSHIYTVLVDGNTTEEELFAALEELAVTVKELRSKAN